LKKTFLTQNSPTFSRAPRGGLFLDALLGLIVALVTTNSTIFAFQSPKAGESPLQIVEAGAERSEDAPFVSSDFHFLPGDYVYFQFQVAGYAIQSKSGGEARRMSLTYEVTPRDGKAVALAPPITGEIKDELNAEDKNWIPKRRASFLLPSFVAAGDYYLHFAVKDLIGNTSIERDVPFHIGGVVVVPLANLSVQDFQFLRKEDDNEALEVPAFSPGDTVYARFNITGFKLAPGNQYHLAYGLTVSRPDGKLYLNEASAADLSDHSYYPVPFVPGNIAVTTTRAAARGEYVLSLTVRDLTGSQTYQLKRVFTVE